MENQGKTMKIKTLCIFLLLASQAIAQDVQILSVHGPTEAPVGTLVIFKADGNCKLVTWSIGEKWKANLYLTDEGRTAVFATPAVPTTIELICAGASDQAIDLVRHSLTVIAGPEPDPDPGPLPGPKPPTPPDPGPMPVPPAPVDPLAAAVRSWLSLVTSPAKALEQKTLADNYAAMAAQVAAGTFQGPQSLVNATNKKNISTLGTEALKRWKPWGDKLAEHLAGRVKEEKLKTLSDYREVWKSIAKGLRGGK